MVIGESGKKDEDDKGSKENEGDKDDEVVVVGAAKGKQSTKKKNVSVDIKYGGDITANKEKQGECTLNVGADNYFKSNGDDTDQDQTRVRIDSRR